MRLAQELAGGRQAEPQVEGGGEWRAGASRGREPQWRRFSFELWETQALCKAAGKTAVARKSLKLQEETRDETDRWTGLPGAQAGEALLGWPETGAQGLLSLIPPW